MRKILISTLIAMGLIVGGESAIAAGEDAETDANDVAVNATITEVVKNIDDYVGKTVTISGEVEEVYGPKSFRIDQEGYVFYDELLVVGAPEFADIEEDEIVQVTGKVRQYDDEEDYEAEIGWELGPEYDTEYEEEDAVITATSVTKLSEEDTY